MKTQGEYDLTPVKAKKRMHCMEMFEIINKSKCGTKLTNTTQALCLVPIKGGAPLEKEQIISIWEMAVEKANGNFFFIFF